MVINCLCVRRLITAFFAMVALPSAFAFQSNVPATPILSPGGGTYASAQHVTVSDATFGAIIYYAINGGVRIRYTGPITVQTSERLEAVAFMPAESTGRLGNSSPGANAIYVINYPIPATPVFSLASGTYPAGQNLVITDATPSARIYVVINGGTPSLYTTPLSISQSESVVAVAIVSPGSTILAGGYSYTSSLPVTAAYSIPAFGVISTVAGNGSQGFSGDGGLAVNAVLHSPTGVALDSVGNLYIADPGNNRIRKITPQGIISTVAGNGTGNFGGDQGPAINAQLNYPVSVALDSAGNLFIGDFVNQRIRKVDNAGIISTVAGSGIRGFSGDGGPATNAQLMDPQGIAVDVSGNLFIADFANHRIRKVDTTGNISTYAGNGVPGYSGDGGAATTAELNYPQGVATDSTGNVFIADRANQRARKVSVLGIISTIAGDGNAKDSGDGGSAINAELSYPYGIATDSQGNIYIADVQGGRIRKIDTAGTISTVAGGPASGGFSGDGGLAINAGLYSPTSVAVDSIGNFYIADQTNQRVRKVTYQSIFP